MNSPNNLPTQSKILALVGARQLTYLEKPLPVLGAEDVLVQTLFSGISHGTEMNVYRGYAPQWSKYFDPKLRLFLPVDPMTTAGMPDRGYWKPSDNHWGYPLAYGYANVGRVLACGSQVSGLAEGDLVFAYEPHQDHYVVSAEDIIRLPDLANPAVGVLYANLTTAYNGVLDAHIHIDDVVVVFGQGIVGLLVTQFARRAGPKQLIVVDGLPARRKLALELGADLALDPAEGDVALAVRKLTGGRGADVVIEVSGSYAALHEAVRTAAYNTTVIAMSWYGGSAEPLRLADEFHHNRITIRCSQVAGIAPELSATHSFARRAAHVQDAFATLQLEPLLSTFVPFAEAARGYDLVDRHSDQIIQVVLTY